MSRQLFATTNEEIMTEVNGLLEEVGRSERMEMRDGALYFEGFTVLYGRYTAPAYDDDPPWAWVCTDHNNPNETVVTQHPDHEGEKWSGSVNKWANFVVSTLCEKENVPWTGDYRSEEAWVFNGNPSSYHRENWYNNLVLGD